MEKLQALNTIEENRGYLCDLSDEIWGYAEMAFQEYKSMEALTRGLKHFGFEVETNVADVETAFTGRWGSGKPVIGFLGEFDALSGLNQIRGLAEKKSENPGTPGHGCGHNLLGVGSLAAAVATKKYLEENHLPGTVIYFGTPGEEGGSGKTFMAREGTFDELDICFTWHPADINVARTWSSLANVQVKYHYHGISAHAAGCPHLGRSALDAVELLNIGVQYLREHMLPDARIHYAITDAGGYSPNVVQPEAEVLYLIRAPKNPDVQELYARVNKIAQAAADMTETKLETTFIKACSNVIPNNVLEAALDKNLHEVPLPELTPEKLEFAKKIRASIENMAESYEKRAASADTAEHRKEILSHIGEDIADYIIPHMPNCGGTSGSTDVGDVSWVCPTAQINTACWAMNTPAHTWQVVAQGKEPIAHDSTMYAGKVMAGAAIDCIMNPELIEQAKAEHKERLGDTKYVCPIPKGVKPTIMKSK